MSTYDTGDPLDYYYLTAGERTNVEFPTVSEPEMATAEQQRVVIDL